VVDFGRGEVRRWCGSRTAILLRVNVVAGHVQCGEVRAGMRECWLGRLAARRLVVVVVVVVVVVAVSALPCLNCRSGNGGESLVLCRGCSLLVVEKMHSNYLDLPSPSTLSSRYCGNVSFTRRSSVNQSSVTCSMFRFPSALHAYRFIFLIVIDG
jgi:hypothetical protein